MVFCRSLAATLTMSITLNLNEVLKQGLCHYANPKVLNEVVPKSLIFC